MTADIRVAVSPGERRVAVVSDGVLVDYAIDRPGSPDGVGDIHIGRITAQRPALAGAFVALAAGAEGFLPGSEGARGMPEGSLLRVRVTRAAQGGKGPRLSGRVPEEAAPAEGPVRLVRRGPDCITRLAARHPAAAIFIDDAGAAARLRPLGRDVRVLVRAFEDWLADAVAELETPSVALPGGARLHVHPTPALTAIDIDGGGASGEARDKAAAQAALNRAILPAIAAQIRLRNLSGGIVVDLAGMKTRRRPTLAGELAACLADDPLQPRFLGFSALGFAEILRKRVHPPLHELLAGPHAAGLAALREAASRVAAAPAERLSLVAAGPVVAALKADGIALGELAERSGRPLMLRSDPALSPCTWQLEVLR